jgi:hypothetical protein
VADPHRLLPCLDADLLDRIVVLGLWLWLGWVLFVRDWTIVSAG